MIGNIALGLSTAFAPYALACSFAGVLLGNLIGVLPGVGALATISLLLPVTWKLDPTGALMMLAGIYYGASFGGATTSILLNLPGTPSHAVVCVDGHPLAVKGRAGAAIFMAMFASFVGVCAGIVLMMLFSPLLVDLALLFGPAEYFSLMMAGLLAASTLGNRSILKGVAAVFIGLAFGVVGTDVNSGVVRFAFGLPDLMDGISLVALAMALFGVCDILANAGATDVGTFVRSRRIDRSAVRPGRGEMRQCSGPIARGSLIGSALGILPGVGGVMASFMSWAAEKAVSKQPQEFGRGAMAGVAGPEAANSSAAITAFIPTLALGIPGDAIMALMLGALMIHNIVPGPMLLTEHAAMFWGLIVSFWVGNLLLLLLNIPLIGIWVKLLSVPYRLIYPVVLFLVCVGVYSVNSNFFDVWEVLVLGVLGYLFAVLGFQPAPMIMGFVLGPLIEENFRRALLLSHGDLSVFAVRPLSGAFLLAMVVMLVVVGLRNMRRRRRLAGSG